MNSCYICDSPVETRDVSRLSMLTLCGTKETHLICSACSNAITESRIILKRSGKVIIKIDTNGIVSASSS